MNYRYLVLWRDTNRARDRTRNVVMYPVRSGSVFSVTHMCNSPIRETNKVIPVLTCNCCLYDLSCHRLNEVTRTTAMTTGDKDGILTSLSKLWYRCLSGCWLR